MSEQLRLVIRRPNDSDSGSEEEKMSTIALSHKAAKLMTWRNATRRFANLFVGVAGMSLCCENSWLLID
jgi:hypothetical protein